MEKKSTYLLKALIDRSAHKEALFSYFDKENLKALPEYPLFQYPSFLLSDFSLKEYHYSWFIPIIQSLPSEQQSLFLSVFDKATAQKINRFLPAPISVEPLAPVIYFPLVHALKEKIQPKEVVPFPLLPQSDLIPLLRLGKEELLHLIDLLGIYDLAADLRQIVDKNILSQIASALTAEQRTFLQTASKQSLHSLPKKMHLHVVHNDPKKLSRLLHKQGMARLAAALRHEESDFIWYLSHKLDTGRAALLDKMRKEEIDEGLIPIFKRQVIMLAKRILNK